MIEGKISLNTKKALVVLAAAAFMAVLLAMPVKAGATIVPPLPKGSIEVNKKVDKDGNGSFETTNLGSNALGFRWGLDSETPARYMGSDADNLAINKTYTVSENSVSGYRFVGWYFNGTDYSCSNPKYTTHPASVSLTYNNKYVELTLCNQRVGTITVTKQTNPHNDPTSFSVTASSSDGGTVYGNATKAVKDNESATFQVAPGYTYLVTETVPAGWTMNSNTCSNLEVGSKPNGQYQSLTVPRDNAPENMDVKCAIDNTKNPTPVTPATPVVLGAQVVAPTGGVGAGSGGAAATNLASVLGVVGSLGAVGFGVRQLRKSEQ